MATWWSRSVLVFVLAASASSARAEGEEPWQIGVTDEQKAVARTALDEGNALYVQNLYPEALAAYEKALAAWQHPAIEFNLAKALIALVRPIEALDHLERAMRFGAKPLGDVWGEAGNYKRLLERQLGTLTVTCSQPGVEVLVDGTPLGPCPTRSSARVMPGRHTIVGRGTGFLTSTRDEKVVGGETPTIDVSLTRLSDAAITRTRWATWKPWLVAGSAAAIGAIGLALELDARDKNAAYRDVLREECGELGCPGGVVSAGAAALRDQAVTRDRLGVAMMIAGGAGIATAVVLLVLNRSYTEYPTAKSTLTLAPTLDAGAFGIVLGGRL